MNLQVRFNASSDVMRNSGGWWIDDVMIASTGLGHAVVLLGSSGPYEAPAGGAVRFNLKVANVGENVTPFLPEPVLPVLWASSLRVVPIHPLNDQLLCTCTYRHF